MSDGFIFNHNKCVSCGACSAACILENGWSVTPRLVYTYNSEAISSQPVINISLACNHCKEAACLKGCPAGSYFREPVTGAILIDDHKCIGCKYCKWNCPYDSPKFDKRKKVIGKCNLCYNGLKEGRMPACTNACPTGALSFGIIHEQVKENLPEWFPEKGLNPAIKFTGKRNNLPLTIIPGNNYDTGIILPHKETRFKTSLLSLVAFTFLSTLAVALVVSSGIKGVFPDFSVLLILITIATVSSLFHLGKVTRAWRAIINIKSSPLSLEIALLTFFSTLSLSGVYFEIPVLMIISSIAGLLFLLSIDNVYNYAEKPKSTILHSGNTFISSLLIISFLAESIIPLIFIAIVKFGITFHNAARTKLSDSFSALRTIRLAFLLISTASLIYNYSLNTTVIVIFLTGELLDRILFYIDFDQLNIKTLIIKYLTISENEKKRS
jgi:Fe-S-cluster-containing dehydrogenase component/DMSO reductase anchor subunit